jgi:cytosine/adenosine deaminase-related metal-dependent hydrolase
MWTEAQRRGIPIWQLTDYICTRPADLFQLEGTKGRLEVGYDADFVILDPVVDWTFDASTSFTSAKWSPFDDWTFRGKIQGTYLRGNPVFAAGQVIAAPGYGQWLRADVVEKRHAEPSGQWSSTKAALTGATCESSVTQVAEHPSEE